MKIGNRNFSDYTYVMAIINLTPDSFFKDSRVAADDALFAAEKAIKDGAAILDLGAQSTRPGYTEVGAKEEISRLEKPLQAILSRFDIPVSVDTYFSEVARFALEVGAHMINDVRGLKSAGMAEEIARAGASVCIMHNSPSQVAGDLFGEVKSFLSAQAEYALACGIERDKICLDGGIGFAKSREQSLELLNGYGSLSSLGYPLLLGASRKSLFGGQPFERLPATLASTRLAAREKVLFVRVHDVKENFAEIQKVYENLR